MKCSLFTNLFIHALYAEIICVNMHVLYPVYNNIVHAFLQVGHSQTRIQKVIAQSWPEISSIDYSNNKNGFEHVVRVFILHRNKYIHKLL